MRTKFLKFTWIAILVIKGINIHPATGNVTALQYNSVITFSSQTTAMPVIKKGGSDVKLYRETDNLIIESDTEITAVKLYNLQGRLLTRQTPQSLSAIIPLPFCPAGIYVVQVIDRQGASVHKIIKR